VAAEHRPDVLCLQELKGLEDTFPSVEVAALGYHIALNAQKTYNGVAILSLDPLTDVQLGLGDPAFDEQAGSSRRACAGSPWCAPTSPTAERWTRTSTRSSWPG
jgi:exonuclease III